MAARRLACDVYTTSWFAALFAFLLLQPATAPAALPQPETFGTSPGATTVRSLDGARITHIQADRRYPLAIHSDSGSVTERAFTFLRAHAVDFSGGASPPDLRLLGTVVLDSVGMSHVRFQQVAGDVPVRGAEIFVHLTNAGVVAASARLATGLETISTRPGIGGVSAVTIARRQMSDRYGIDNAQFTDPELEIYDVGLLNDEVNQPRLSWFINARAGPISEYLWIDAHSGALLASVNQTATALDRQILDGRNSTTLPIVVARSEGDAASRVPEINVLYDLFGTYYNFFLQRFGRDGVDARGARMVGIARACDPSTACPMTNAYWDGVRVSFGDGFVVTDVVAHELTHALIQHTANFLYRNQSGALSESYADILGETIQLKDPAHSASAATRWLIGENLDIPGFIAPGTGLRSMADPNSYDEPASTGDARYACNPDIDNGGVHTNSGVGNKAYALVVDGGTYNGYTVRGIGLDKAVAVHYRALAFYLGSASTYLDNYHALVAACADLATVGQLTIDDCAQLKKAMLAVEMTTRPCSGEIAPAPPPDALAPLAGARVECPVGQIPRYAYFDDFENTAARNWVATGGDAWQDVETLSLYATGLAQSGLYSLHGSGAIASSDSAVAMQRNVSIVPGSLLRFESNFELEGGFDAGVIEYSTDSGATWIDAGVLVRAGRNYNGGVAAGLNNSLTGRRAFTGNSIGYRTTMLDLSSLAGSSARFRFRIATDSGVSSPGWWVDNVAIYSCRDAGLLVGAGAELVTGQGLSATFAVSLTRAPASHVVVPVSVSDRTLAAVSPTGLVFTPGNWNVAQIITVTGNSRAEKTYTIRLGPTRSDDPEFDAIPVVQVTARNTGDAVSAKTAAASAAGALDWIALAALLSIRVFRQGRGRDV